MKTALRLLLLLTALPACEQVIEPDLPEHRPRLVLQAFFTFDGVWTAHVGRSFRMLDLRLAPYESRTVADAEVELLAGDRVVSELAFSYSAQAYLFDGDSLEAGETYSLQVSAPGFEAIRATDAVPRPVPTSILWFRAPASSRSGSGSGDFSVKLEIEDPPGEENYYQVSLYRVFAGRGASRIEYSFSTNDPSILADNSVDGSPFEEGGFEGGAPYFRDTLFDGRTHRIELSTDFGSQIPRSRDPESESDLSGIHLQVLYISEAYYEYLKSARLHDYTQDNPFAEPLNVQGNVENGYGIFAGYSSRTFELTLDE